MSWKSTARCIRLSTEESVVDPADFVKRENITLPTQKCILTFNGRTTNIIKNLMDTHKLMPIKIPIFDPTLGEYSGEKIFVGTLSIGAPASTLTLELLIAAGTKEIIIIGTAGSINPNIKIGDILLPTWGIREEGTSYHYMPPNYIPKPNRELLRRFKKEIENAADIMKVVEGGIWSTDAVFRETKDKIREYRKMGIIGVDMESTALMTVAEYRKASLAIALIISDELKEDSWTYAWNTEKITKSEHITALASLKTLSK